MGVCNTLDSPERPRGKFLGYTLVLIVIVASSQSALLIVKKSSPDRKEDCPFGSESKSVSFAHSQTRVPRWAVEGESNKSGAGLLFFAYGGRSTLRHFLREAEQAARTLRKHNPNISMAIVTNHEKVDPSLFDVHINPRVREPQAHCWIHRSPLKGSILEQMAPSHYATNQQQMTPHIITWSR